MFIWHWRSENSPDAIPNSQAKFCFFLRELCPSIIILLLLCRILLLLQFLKKTLLLHQTITTVFFDNYFLDFLAPKCMYTHANQYFNVDKELLIIILKQTLPEQEKTAAVRN